MTRFARTHTVIFWEEPIEDGALAAPLLDLSPADDAAVRIATPRLPQGMSAEARERSLATLLDDLLKSLSGPLVRWYYTPAMLGFSAHVPAACIVYDCMDELANFRFAPPELLTQEQELLDAADVVFTGGYSLYEAKRDRHDNAHPFPSSVDREHFARARTALAEPADQAALPHPRLGFYGVIDERFDTALLAAIADAHPEWSLVMVGPVVKIAPEDLPRRPNIHYLGSKGYAELPAYLAGWDVALMPFAINEATRFISPTKTPEYLAGGVPVVSTPIRDVVRHYGELEAVCIGTTAQEFIAGCERALAALPKGGAWLAEIDEALADLSWDVTQARMAGLIARLVEPPRRSRPMLAAMTHVPTARRYDYLVVGCGFAGSVLAERLASQLGARVLMIDKRPHIAGNAFDRKDAAGILMHQYGPHIFHTNSDEIVDYLSKFTRWRPYEHRVLARVADQLVPIPINRTTLNLLFQADLKDDADAAAFLAARAEPVADIKTSRDVVVSTVGRELYELFFEGYTRKQWGLDPSQLDRSVTARIPTRTNTDDRYFTDKHQVMPLHGYTAMFERMLDHPLIERSLGTDYRDVRDEIDADHIIYTGPIDEYFDWRFGELPYRSLRFEHRTLDQPWSQPVGTVNYPSTAVPYTRISEYKHLTGQKHSQTSITFEYPAAEGDPYYPIPREENQLLFKRYEALADLTDNVTFVGRLATYRYYNMDQIVGQALAAFRRLAAQSPAKLDDGKLPVAV